MSDLVQSSEKKLSPTTKGTGLRANIDSRSFPPEFLTNFELVKKTARQPAWGVWLFVFERAGTVYLITASFSVKVTSQSPWQI